MSIKRLEIDNLQVGGARVAIRFRRVGKACHVDPLDVTGGTLRTGIEIG